MTDLEIAQNTKIQNINEIAAKIGIADKIINYGENVAKIKYEDLKNSQKGNLILVTATSPTPFGEGKTTISIGLNDALCHLGYKAIASLREPSLGPVFGLKGGATGGGYSQVIPMEEINLHFTGDFHAITSANNLLCAAIDNHIHQGNALNIAENKILFNRCLDVNDRALKDLTINDSNYQRKEKYDITAASEIMAILCLAKNIDDLKTKLDNILIGFSKDNKPIFAKSLNVTGAMLVLLKDALKPNLVQTLEHNPVIIHGGPFANIAHGCSSIIATNTALKLADYCVTEAGFGSDLGALKFFDIKCRNANLNPSAVVLVTTIKALKYNGHNNLKEGISNLQAHLDILNKLTTNVIVCLNKYTTDTPEEINFIKEYVTSKNIEFSVSTAYEEGSKGCLDLAKKVIGFNNKPYKKLYEVNDLLETKIKIILKDILHAKTVNFTNEAIEKIAIIKENNLDKLPICIAKTQYSISDDKEKLGNPQNYEVTVKDIKLYNGAGFITIYLGNILTMPGLPLKPNYEKINLEQNRIIGLS